MTHYETNETTRLFLSVVYFGLFRHKAITAGGFQYSGIDGTIWADNVDLVDLVKTLDDDEGYKTITFKNGDQINLTIKNNDGAGYYSASGTGALKGIAESIEQRWVALHAMANYY